jgi:hypothetical protein
MITAVLEPRYDSIGVGYSQTRREDPRIAACIRHHWDEDQEVIVTFDPQVSGRMWLMADYFREVAELDERIFPTPELLAQWLGTHIDVKEIPIARDAPDWMLGAFWAHPERVLDPQARAARELSEYDAGLRLITSDSP